jgi:hypothetical protein
MRMNIISKLTTMTSLFTAIVALAQIGLAQEEIPMPTEKGSIVLLFGGFSFEPSSRMGHLQAAIRNDTHFAFKAVWFEMVGYDAKGDEIKLCAGAGRCEFGMLAPIEPGQTRRIIPPADSEYFYGL